MQEMPQKSLVISRLEQNFISSQADNKTINRKETKNKEISELVYYQAY